MTTQANALKSANSRVFIIEGRAKPSVAPTYEYSLRMTGVTQGFGDITKVESPDPNQYGNFIQIGEIRGATARATTSLQGRYALDVKSELMRLGLKGCGVDVQLHLGECYDPTQFNKFTKAIILENAYLSNYSTDDLGALESGENKFVNETADISAKSVYEIVPITWGEKAGSVITNEIVDICIADSASCGGNCGSASDGCQRIIGISKAAGGSAGTPPDAVYSIDKGVTWLAIDIDSIRTAEDSSGVVPFGSYVVVCAASALDYGLHYALITDFDGVGGASWTKVQTGFAAGYKPVAMAASMGTLFIVGTGGYIWTTTDPTAGATAVETGSLMAGTYHAVHALSSSQAIAVGAGGVVAYTTNGTTWARTALPPTNAALTCCYMKTNLQWFVGTATGFLYYTENAGNTWTAKSFPGSGTGVCEDIVFVNDSVGYLSHTTATPTGRVLRTYDGGYSWTVTPETTGSFPSNQGVRALAVCAGDTNFVVGGGLGAATDGTIVLGSG